jgi:hypothetical protein
MMMTRLIPLALLLAILPSGLALRSARGSNQSCTSIQLAIDTTGADYAVAPFDSRGFGEVIPCRDTIVTSITYWQPPFQISFEYYARLYVTAVDSTGRPYNNIIYRSPILHGVDTDTIRPSPIVFVFNPPLVLPGTGKYFFDVKADDGACGGMFWLLADTTNRYPDGAAWETGKFCDPSSPGSSSGWPGLDMIFDIEFCDTHTTPVTKQTWGGLKSRYR